MNKETLIKKLLNEKAEKNNTIDLNAYALGLDAMYEALVLYGVMQRSELLLDFLQWYNDHHPENYIPNSRLGNYLQEKSNNSA